MESMETVDTGSLEGAAEAAEQESQEVESTVEEQTLAENDKKPVQRFKVKVDGEELEVDEAELKRSYAHAKAAAKRMEEAAEMRKAYQKQIAIAEGFEKFIHNVKDNPEAIFALAEQLGHDVDDLVMKRAAERLKYEYMDESQRRAYDNERELNRYKQIEAQQREAQRQQAEQQALANVRQSVENELVEFFTESQIKPTPEILERIALLKYNAGLEGKRISVADAYKHAKASIDKARARMLANLSEDDFKNLPDDARRKLRQTDMKQFNQTRRPTAQASAPQVKKPMSTDDFFAMKDKQFSKRK